VNDTRTAEEWREHPLAVLRRGIPILAATTVIVAVLAVAFALRQDNRYSASAEVFVTQSLENAITGVTVLSPDPDRVIATQSEVARVPAVAELVAESVDGQGVTPQAVLDNSSAIPNKEADVMTFEVTWGDKALATELANAYARAYLDYRQELDTGSIDQAEKGIQQELNSIKSISGVEGRFTDLLDESQRLRTLKTLRGSSSSLGRPATSAKQVQPRPIRNGLLGGFLGLILGIALVLSREALNTRIRSAREVEEHLGMPLIARLPPPPKRFADRNQLSSIEEPHTPQAESYRMLATNVDLLNLDRGVSSIMIASGVHEEGKSTTTANLAVAFARRGLHVVLLEADTRRPIMRKFFDLDEGRPGLTDAALGRASLDEALAEIELPSEEGSRSSHSTAAATSGAGKTKTAAKRGDGSGDVTGKLEVMLGEPAPPSAADFLKSQAVADVLKKLQERSDLLLIDTPPLLHVSDAVGLMLSGSVDCVVLAVRVGRSRRQPLDEVRRILEGAPVVTLGFFATGEEDRPGYGGGYYSYYYGDGRQSGLLRRPSDFLRSRRGRKQPAEAGAEPTD
jgi:tyrosine-protein kinase